MYGTDAPNFPVKILSVNKVSEIVTLQNVSEQPVDLTGWKMLSVRGNQVHRGIEGTLAPGEKRYFANTGKKIWNDARSDNGALYDQTGQLISYWRDPS
jgi:micrococcal nuclease